jgi:methionyl aminopeptidase
MLRSGKIRLKSPDDIKRIRDAGDIIAEVFRELSKRSFAGMSTWEVDSIVESIILTRKARPAFKTVAGYNSASCISINDEVVHGIPSKKRKIKNGDLVKVDTGAVLKGYFSDACYTFAAGTVSDVAAALSGASRQALKNAIAVMRPGNRIGDIGYAIQEYIEARGYSVVRTYTGHGVGFSLHEPPIVPHYGKKSTGIVLESGMVLAVEPMINEGGHAVRLLGDGWTAVTADGKLSAHFEHTIAITDDGPLVLTG